MLEKILSKTSIMGFSLAILQACSSSSPSDFDIKATKDIYQNDTQVMFQGSEIDFCEKKPYFLDDDDDKHGDKEKKEFFCEQPNNYVENSDDCDDTNANINPGKSEKCNGIDDNCNKLIDEYLQVNDYFQDSDKDGYGNLTVSFPYCKVPLGYVDNSMDCDDTNTNINPGKTEECNGIDDNCDNKIDEGFPLHNWYVDKDKDQFGSNDSKITNCKKTNNDYILFGGDCDDFNPNVNSNATEICDNLDNDCNGKIDEIPVKNCFTSCENGIEECVNGIWKDCSAKKPELEICDGIDNDCDGSIDNELPEFTWYLDSDKDGFGNPNEKIEHKCQGVITDLFGNPVQVKEIEIDGEKYVSNSLDCNDDKSLTKQILWHKNINCNTTTLLSINKKQGNDGRVYVNDSTGKLYVLRSSDGLEIKKIEEVMLSPAIGKDGTIYGRDPNKDTLKITAYNSTLIKKWDYFSSGCVFGWASGGPESGGLYDFSVAFDGSIYASIRLLDTDWVNEYCGYIDAIDTNGKKKWRLNTSYYNSGTSIGSGEIIFSGDLYSLFTMNHNGTLKWEKKSNSEISSMAPIFDSFLGHFYILTEKGNLNYYKNEGQLIWSVKDWKQTPVIDSQGRLFSGSGAYSSIDGKVIWNANGNYSGAAVAENSTVYLFGKDGLNAVNADDGKSKWKINIAEDTNVSISPVNLAIGVTSTGAVLYFCNETDNKVYAVCGNDSLDTTAPWPIEKHDNQRTNNINTSLK